MRARDFGRGAAGARTLDAADELRAFRARFALPKDGRRTLTYLCGHSLGLMPREVPGCVGAELERWAELGVEGHFADAPPRRERARAGASPGPEAGWLDYHERFSAPLAKLVGAQPDEVVAMNSLTVNLHLMLASFYRPTGAARKILIEAGRVPLGPLRGALADRASTGSIRRATLDRAGAARAARRCCDVEDIEACLERSRRAASRWCCCPACSTCTGQAFDLAAHHAAARRRGCASASIWRTRSATCRSRCTTAMSISPSGAATSISTPAPGAVGGCFVHERHGDALDLPRFAGWWGHDAADALPHGAGVRAVAPARTAGSSATRRSSRSRRCARRSSIFADAGMGRLRAKSRRATGYLELADARAARPQVRDHHAARARASRLPAFAARRPPARRAAAACSRRWPRAACVVRLARART